jgi:hypothetical protein
MTYRVWQLNNQTDSAKKKQKLYWVWLPSDFKNTSECLCCAWNHYWKSWMLFECHHIALSVIKWLKITPFQDLWFQIMKRPLVRNQASTSHVLTLFYIHTQTHRSNSIEGAVCEVTLSWCEIHLSYQMLPENSSMLEDRMCCWLFGRDRIHNDQLFWYQKIIPAWFWWLILTFVLDWSFLWHIIILLLGETGRPSLITSCCFLQKVRFFQQCYWEAGEFGVCVWGGGAANTQTLHQ